MFHHLEDVKLRNEVRKFVNSELIPLEKENRSKEDHVSSEIANPLRQHLIKNRLIGHSAIDSKNKKSAYSVMAVYEELTVRFLDFGERELLMVLNQ